MRTTTALLGILILTAPATAQTLEARWADLVSPDEAKATRAMLALAANPKEAVPLLKERLLPVKADSKRVEQLVGQLKSGNFAIRNLAMADLEYLGKYIKADLEKALKVGTDIETNARLKQLLDKMPKDEKAAPPKPMPFKARPGSSISVSNINGQIQIMIDGVPLDFNKMATPPPPPPGPSPLWVRAVRAVTILEHLGTPEARRILQAIADGEAGAMPTEAAREALKRLN